MPKLQRAAPQGSWIVGGYALARSGKKYAFYLLMLALIFRAMPHITLVSGYLLPFFEWNVWGILPTTLVVLVAINQPFTLWMLHLHLHRNTCTLHRSTFEVGPSSWGAVVSYLAFGPKVGGSGRDPYLGGPFGAHTRA